MQDAGCNVFYYERMGMEMGIGDGDERWKDVKLRLRIRIWHRKDGVETRIRYTILLTGSSLLILNLNPATTFTLICIFSITQMGLCCCGSGRVNVTYLSPVIRDIAENYVCII
jgi:hypothetical protein